ncbi:MAG: hypothetical protein M9900_13915 [Flavobacteriales bacterium]|nr:hypothetical protein [Flavobacteriales bacterium]
MHFPNMIRPLGLLLLVELAAGGAMAQGDGGSPYSAYGLGDLITTGQAVQALSAGTGTAITEPFSVIPGNPASYPLLARPVFESAVSFTSLRSTAANANSTARDLRFMGFSLGVPFGQGKWGLALGLAPFSKVGYEAVRSDLEQGIPVQYKYTGSGGLDRAFVGLGRTLYQQRADSVGNAGTRINLGADFNFVFGSIGATREALYPLDDGYSNIRAFSNLFLAAPTATVSAIWQGDLTKKTTRDDRNWRWSAGISMGIPANLKAQYSNLVTSYTVRSGIEVTRDTVEHEDKAKGHVRMPVRLKAGIGVQNANWAFALERTQQDWNATAVEVPGYEWSSSMRNTVSWAAAARFRPGGEGGIFHRSVYRMGFRLGQAPQQVRGNALNESAITAGISLPLNAVQTNSWLHLGVEMGQRGTLDHGLLQEQRAVVWIGLAFTPWRGERWFTPSKIQ